MLKKIFLVLSLFLLMLGQSFAQECSFSQNNCDRIIDSFVTFNLDFGTEVKSYEARLYDQTNSQNEFRLNIEDNKITNLNPLVNPGVYVLDLEIFNSGGYKTNLQKTFIFDNTEPMPPLIPVDIVGSSVTGKTQVSNSLVIAENKDGGEIGRVISDVNGDFAMDLAGISNGINYVKFYILGKNTIKSEVIERIVLGSEIDFNSETVSNIVSNNLDNEITIQRNYYVFGTANGNTGAEVYVNGERAFFGGKNFGAFVLLNEGDNNVVIKSGTVEKSFNVKYVNPRFQFLKYDFPKFVKSQEIQNFEIDTNLDLPVRIYLNGKFYSEEMPVNGKLIFNFEQDQLDKVKNYLYVEGYNSQKISEIFYLDKEEPLVEVLTLDKLSVMNEFVFKVTDDLGVNGKFLELNINGEPFAPEDVKIKGEFYEVKITEPKSSGTYDIKVHDLAGNEVTKSGTFEINSENTIIEDIFMEKGTSIGNYLFFRESESEVYFTPSRNIAFKSISVDGVDFTKYEIFENDQVKVNFDLKIEKGLIEMTFINNEYQEFKETFYYFTDKEEPQLYLDNIVSSSTSEMNPILISGEIEDSYFDFDSLKINDKKAFNRFGKYFEANVYLEDSGLNLLNIFGNDVSGNLLDYNFNDILYYDTQVESLKKGVQDNFDSYSLGFELGDDFAKNYLSSYDGFYFHSLYLDKNSFELPLPQRYGYRNLNFKGIEDSKLKFTLNENYNLVQDGVGLSSNIPLDFYFEGVDKKTNLGTVFVSGNIVSNNNVNSVSVSNGNCVFDSFSFVCEVSLSPGNNNVNVIINDGKGTVEKSVNIYRVHDELLIRFEDNPFEGMVVIKTDDGYLFAEENVNANVYAMGEGVVSLIVDGNEKFYGIRNGSLTLDLNLAEEIAGKEEDEFEVVAKIENEFGDKAFSDKAVLIYNRVLETLLKIFIS